MGDIRYYAETPCETCRGTGWIPDEPDGWDIPDMSMGGCPDCQPGIGGTGSRSRREITPNIDAAFLVMSGDVIEHLTEDEIRKGRKLVAEAVDAEAVDAALGRGDAR